MIPEIRSVRERPNPWTVVLFSVICWLVAMLQVGCLNRMPLFGATIELLFASVCLIGWKKGAVTGAVTGIVGGFTLDALSAVSISLSPLLFALAGIWMGRIARRLFDHPLTYLLSVLPAFVCLSGLRAVTAARFSHLFAVLLGGMLASAALYLPAAVRWIKRCRK